MYSLAITLQIIATISCLASVIVMMFRKPTSYSNIIIITFLCVFVQNAGYILELLSKNVDDGLMAVRAEYLGGAFEIGLMTFFIFKYCGHEFNRLIKWILIAEAVFVLLGVWSWKITHFYYTDAKFIGDAVIPHLSLSHGWLYYLFAVTTVVELIACMFILVVSILKTNQEHMKYNYIVLMFVVIIPLIGFILSVSGGLGGYDSTPIGAAIAISIFAFAIAKDHVFDVADVASEKILSNLENAIIIINSENGYEYSNNRARELFPVLNTYTRGNIIKDFEVRSLFDTGRAKQIKIGNHIFDVSLNTVKEKNYEVGTAVILFDITDSKQQIVEMQLLKEEAEKANKAKSIFLASVSHELRTPINVIMGMTEVLLRDYRTDATELYLENIRNSSSTLLSLINDMLDYSKIESGNMEINKNRFDLRKMLSEMVNIYSFRSEQSGIEFRYEIAEDIPRFVVGDVSRIRQVLVTLLSNSVKFTEKGYVSFKVGYKARSESDYDLIMAVEDTGMGIPPESYGKIYEGLAEGVVQPVSDTEGTGLGLNITKQLVELMGGVINFKSVVGKGSVFSVIIPVSVVSDGKDITTDEKVGVISKEKQTKVLSYTAPKANILVVDDMKVNLLVAKNLLKPVMATVTTVDSGEKCLEITEKEHFDLILMDYRMPGMDGVETLSRMRSGSGKCDNTPVIIYTANASSDSRAYYISKGFSDFLSKPTTGEQLMSVIYKHLPEDKIVTEV